MTGTTHTTDAVYRGVAGVLGDLTRYASSAPVQWIGAGLVFAATVGLVLRARRPAANHNGGSLPPATGTTGGTGTAAGRAAGAAGGPAVVGRRWLIGLAVAAALGVAALGGVRSLEAVSVKFNSPLVPLTADGMIIACTALRLAALTRGWRLPGSVATTYGFIAGTVWLNIAAARGWTDAVAHALAPVSYAVLVEMLAHVLRLHLRLAQPSRPRVTALTWFTSPAVTTRVWLHMARTGEPDPVAARALVQQVIRMSSRLSTVCPSRPLLGWLPFLFPFDRARAARVAALQTIRDGLLTAADLAALLPQNSTHLDAGALLAMVDRAALQCTANAPTGRTTDRTATRTGERTGYATGAPDGDRTSAPEPVRTDAAQTPPASPATAGRAGRDERTDDELVLALHRYAQTHNGGRALSQREVMRVLGVGTPKAKRLAARAGWAEPTPAANTNTQAVPPANAPPAQIAGQLALVTRPHDDEQAETDSDKAPTRTSR
jgi:Protein of unknown function (DUF2637)